MNAQAKLRSVLMRLLPRRLTVALIAARSRRELRVEYRADRRRYGRFSLPGEVNGSTTDWRNIEAQLTKDYHRIEKGLALPQPKRPFGAAVSERIAGNILVGGNGNASEVVKFAMSARDALYRWNTEGTISSEIAPLAAVSGDRGVVDAHRFFSSRHSVRNFGDIPVPTDLLRQAVELALRSPSVCNRQAWLIRFFWGADVPRILAHQNGNSGFADVVPVVALVTTDSRLFAAAGERNQPWIEGGIFSMSFVWALHALGLDSCMLNMSVGNRSTDALRREFQVPDSELVIMMIAIGYAAPGYRVARSPRRDISQVVISPGPEQNASFPSGKGDRHKD